MEELFEMQDNPLETISLSIKQHPRMRNIDYSEFLIAHTIKYHERSDWLLQDGQSTRLLFSCTGVARARLIVISKTPD